MNDAEAKSLADYAVSRGTMTRAQADAALATDAPIAPPAAPAAPAAAAANTPAPPAVARAPDPAQSARREAADRLVELGQLSREDADFLLASDQPAAAAPSQQTNAAPPPPADPLASIELDPAFDRPASADDYRFPPIASGNITPNELRAMGQLAFQARLPKPIAHELASIADSYAVQQMSDQQIEVLTRRTMAELHRRYGSQAETKIALARRLVDQVSRVNPALTQLLGTGAGSDIRFVTHVIEHASRMYGDRLAD